MSSAETPSPLKRPRLSLRIEAIAGSPSVRASSRTLAAAVDVKDPTDFNTLSNVYATAVDRVTTPVQEIMSPRMAPGSSARKPRLQLQTSSYEAAVPGGSHRRTLPTPYATLASNTATTPSPTTALFPSAATLSSANPHQPGRAAGPQSLTDSRLLSGVTPMILPSSTYATSPISLASPSSLYASSHRNNTLRRRGSMPGSLPRPPYTHPRALRSILRNSPLPPLSAGANKSPVSPRRQSLRLQQQRERAARRVAYNSPLCQTITTSKYTQSHMELVHQHQHHQHQHQQNLDTDDDDSTPMSADSTPSSPSSSSDSQDGSSSASGAEEREQEQDMFLLSPGLDTRDGGQTPGPIEEMRRRPTGAGLGGRGGSTIISSSSSSSQPLSAVSFASAVFSSSAPASTPLLSSSSLPTTALGSGGGSSGGGGGRTEAGGVRKRNNGKRRSNRNSVHSSGNCNKRPKQHEKKRLWMWTIGSDGSDLEADVLLPMTAGEAQRRRQQAVAAAAVVPVLAVPVPPVRSRSSSVSGADGAGDGGGGSKSRSQTPETAVRTAPPPLLVQVAAPGPGTGRSVQVLGFAATRSRRPVGGRDGAAMLEIPGRAGEKNPVGDQGKARRRGGGGGGGVEGFTSFGLVTAAAADPEPEPPTPSVESTASHQDSVFEADVDGDVDMSDASSLTLVDDVDDVLAMDAADDKTPTTSARPLVFEMT